MFNQSTQPPAQRRMLATDLDGTLVGHPEAFSHFNTVMAEYKAHWMLVYATGRSLPSAQRLAREDGLVTPDVWVTEVGAAITYADGTPDETWRARMAEHWDRDIVDQLASAYPGMSYQPAEAMGPYKVSFRITPDMARTVLPALERHLARKGVPCLLVYSSQRDLDIVPAAAGKGAAVTYLSEKFNIPLSNIVTAGDSANDRSMLTLGGPAIAVGNAQDELLLPQLPDTVHLAKGHCAAGILEGLAHYEWIKKDQCYMASPMPERCVSPALRGDPSTGRFSV